MNTNKYIQLIALWAITLMGLTSCDKEGVLDEEITGYQKFETSFAFPINIDNNYTYILNGDTLKNGKGFLPRTETTGKLEVFEKGSTKAAYSGDINLTKGNTIQLIKLGEKIDIYSPDSYTQFTVDVKWATESEAQKFKALYNGVEISTSSLSKNYVSKKDLTDTLQIIKRDDNQVVVDREITIEPEGTITLLQLSEEEFVTLPPGEEKDPESDDYKKVRVYYTKTDELTEDSYTIKFYTFDGWEYSKDNTQEITSLEIKAGELTPYITVYGRTYESTTTGPTFLTYELISKDGTVIRDHDPNKVQLMLADQNWDVDYFKYLNKFETYNINTAGNASLVLKETW